MTTLHQMQKHPEYVEGCFGCKVSTLELSTGDANAKKSMSDKKWNAELDAYKQARSEGIQPNGTSMKEIVAAKKASENLGRAYDGNTMPKATKINKTLAGTMNQLGM